MIFDPNGKDGWVVAVILCIISAAFSNLGTNVQKLAWHRYLLGMPKPEELSVDDAQSYISYSGFSAIPASTPKIRRKQSVTSLISPSLNTPLNPKDDVIETIENSSSWGFSAMWWLGLLSIGIGALLDFMALGFGAQSIVAPLGSLTLVFNLLFANLLHEEKVEKSDYRNTFLILSGCILAVICSSKKSSVEPIDSLFTLFTSQNFFFYSITTLLIICFLQNRLRSIEKKLVNLTSTQRVNIELQERLIFPILSGICGAQSVLFAKLLDELFLSTLADKGKFYNQAESLLVVFALLLSITSQIYYMNEGLKKFSSLSVVPVFQSTWIIYSVCGGGFVYKEFDHLSTFQVIFFAIGIALIVSGVYSLSQTQREELDKSFVEE